MIGTVTTTASDTHRAIDAVWRIESAKLIAGYSLIEVKSLAEAIEWAKRAPMDTDGTDAELEIRQLFELEDFAPGDAIEHHRKVQDILTKK